MNGADKVAITLMWLVPTILVVGLSGCRRLLPWSCRLPWWRGWVGSTPSSGSASRTTSTFSPTTRRSGRRSRTTWCCWSSCSSCRRCSASSWRVLIDRELRGSRFYQTSYLPAGRAGAGRLHLAAALPQGPGPDQRRAQHGRRLAGDPSVNFYAVLVAGWKQAGYIMLIYLAGLKGVDLSLREAAKADGAWSGKPSSGWSSR